MSRVSACRDTPCRDILNDVRMQGDDSANTGDEMTGELTFDGWLSATADERAAIIEFSKQAVLDVDKAIQKSDECGKLEKRAEWYLTQATARATLTSKTKYPQLSADERRIMVKDEVKNIQYILDAYVVTGRSIRDRIYSQNRR